MRALHLAATAVVAVLLLAGCGGGAQLLSSGEAGQLNSRLAKVQSALAAKQCGTAQRALQQLSNDVNSLSGVDARLLENLHQGVSTTQSLAAGECPVQSGTTTTTMTTTTTTTTATQTTPTTTTPTTPSTPTKTTAPPPSHTSTTPTTPSRPTTPSTPAKTTPPSGGTGLPSQ
jgi:hypothetical protein